MRNQRKMWVYLPLCLFLLGTFISYNNIMRHMVAFSIFICSITYLADRQYLKYIACILLAACFHKSALTLLFIPIIYILCNNVFRNRLIEFAVVGLGLVMMNINYVQNIFEALSVGMMMLGYDMYMATHYAEYDNDASIGLGFALLVFVNLVVMYYSKQMKEFYKSRTVAIMYDMYVWGFFVKLAMLRMFLIQRLNYYFISFSFIIVALTLYMLAKKDNWVVYCGILLIYAVLFFMKLNVADDGSVLYHSFLEYR